MNAYIVAGYRSAVGKAPKGTFRFTRPDDLGAEVIKYMMAQVPELDPARVDDLIVGNAVPEAEQGMQIARYISLLALPKSVPGFTINRYCGSGVEAIALAAGLCDITQNGDTAVMLAVRENDGLVNLLVGNKANLDVQNKVAQFPRACTFVHDSLSYR